MAKLSPEEAKAAEKERMKKQLVFLGILLVAVAYVNRKTFFGVGKKSRIVRGRGRGAPRGRAAAPAARAAAKAPARRAAPNRAALTPDMIPELDQGVKDKIAARWKEKVGLIPEDEIRYETRNPFIALGIDDREIIKRQDEKLKAKPVSSGVEDPVASPSGLVFFRGVVPIGPKRFAILQTNGSRRPKPIAEGSMLGGNSPWRLVRIGPKDAFVVLYNPEAKRDREKISVVTRDGVGPEDSAEAQRMLHASSGQDVPNTGRRGSITDTTATVMLALLQKEFDEASRVVRKDSGFLVPASRMESKESKPMKEEPSSEAAGDTSGADDFEFFEN